jgi:hypothetical protein
MSDGLADIYVFSPFPIYDVEKFLNSVIRKKGYMHFFLDMYYIFLCSKMATKKGFFKMIRRKQ